jgi:hypothetical protein
MACFPATCYYIVRLFRLSVGCRTRCPGGLCRAYQVACPSSKWPRSAWSAFRWNSSGTGGHDRVSGACRAKTECIKWAYPNYCLPFTSSTRCYPFRAHSFFCLKIQPEQCCKNTCREAEVNIRIVLCSSLVQSHREADW